MYNNNQLGPVFFLDLLFKSYEKRGLMNVGTEKQPLWQVLFDLF